MTAAPLLVFDLDGTLVDSVADLADAANRLLARHGQKPLREAEVRRMVGDGVPALVRRAMAARGLEPGEDDIPAFTRDYIAHAADRSRPFDGIPEMLERARAGGWRLAVCTNKPVDAARALLAALGLGDSFDVIGGGDSFPVRKPDPRHLLSTIERAGGAPERSVMVGDHHNDVAAGNGAGVPVIFAAWGYGTEAMQAGADAVAAGPAGLLDEAYRLLAARGGR